MQKKHWKLAFLALALGSCLNAWGTGPGVTITDYLPFNIKQTGGYQMTYQSPPDLYSGITVFKSLGVYQNFLFTTEGKRDPISSNYSYGGRIQAIPLQDDGAISDLAVIKTQDLSSILNSTSSYIASINFYDNKAFLTTTEGRTFRYTVDLAQSEPLIPDNGVGNPAILTSVDLDVAPLTVGNWNHKFFMANPLDTNTANALARLTLNTTDFSLESDTYTIRLQDPNGITFAPYAIASYGSYLYVGGKTQDVNSITTANYVLSYAIDSQGNVLKEDGITPAADGDTVKGTIAMSNGYLCQGLGVFQNRLYLNNIFDDPQTTTLGSIEGYYLKWSPSFYSIEQLIGFQTINGQTLSFGQSCTLSGINGASGTITFTAPDTTPPVYTHSDITGPIAPGEKITVEVYADSTKVLDIDVEAGLHDISNTLVNNQDLNILTNPISPGVYTFTGNPDFGGSGSFSITVDPNGLLVDLVALAPEINGQILGAGTHTIQGDPSKGSTGTITFYVQGDAPYDINSQLENVSDIHEKYLQPGTYSLKAGGNGVGIINFNVPQPQVVFPDRSQVFALNPGEVQPIIIKMNDVEVNSKTISANDVKIQLANGQTLFLDPGTIANASVATTDDSWVGSQGHHSLEIKAKDVMLKNEGESVLNNDAQTTTLSIKTTDETWTGDQADILIEGDSTKINYKPKTN